MGIIKFYQKVVARGGIQGDIIGDAGSIGTAELANLAVTAAKLGAGAVETAKIDALAVTPAELAVDAVETAKILDLNVTTAKLAADAVDETKLNISLPLTLALPATLGNRIGGQLDGVLIGRLTRQAVDAAIAEDNSDGPSYIDETTDANSAGANDVAIPDPFDANDALYIGMNNIFSSVVINIGTQGVGDAVEAETVWEYSKGSDTWGSLTEVTDTSVALSGTTGAKVLSFLPPADWAVDTINSQGPFFFIRLRSTAADVYNTTQTIQTQIWAQELIVGQGVVCPFTGVITAVDLNALTASATNDDTELLLINLTQGTFTQLTWTGGDEIERITGLTLAVTAGDEIVVHMITQDGSTEFADAQLILQIDV